MIVILNVRAGTIITSGDSSNLKLTIAALFSGQGLNPEIISVDAKDVGAAARQAVANNQEIIIAAGGDGTVSAVAAELAGTEKALGVLPLGTLNHFAKDLHLPLDLEDAVRIIAGRNVRAFDVGELNGRVFVNNVSVGIYPHIVHRRVMEQLRIGKRPAYIWAIMYAFRRCPFIDLRIDIEGKILRRKTAFLFVGNNQYQMEGFRIGERRGLDDAKLSLYLTHRVGRWGLIRLAVRALLGHLSQEKDFETYFVDEAFVESRRHSVLVATDGEVHRMESPMHFRSRPRALRVLVPPTM